MSKITLSPNASGTGTFTIASPNSNTDRTLTLPDGSGALYNQSNIVGTVSESGGVPTGAIIERGSNANGEYVKYADGTMICSESFTNTFSTAAYGTALRVGAVATWTYPVAFAATPVVTGYSGDNSVNGWVSASATTTSANLRHVTTTSTITLFLGRYTAVGRWF